MRLHCRDSLLLRLPLPQSMQASSFQCCKTSFWLACPKTSLVPGCVLLTAVHTCCPAGLLLCWRWSAARQEGILLHHRTCGRCESLCGLRSLALPSLKHGPPAMLGACAGWPPDALVHVTIARKWQDSQMASDLACLDNIKLEPVTCLDSCHILSQSLHLQHCLARFLPACWYRIQKDE